MESSCECMSIDIALTTLRSYQVQGESERELNMK